MTVTSSTFISDIILFLRNYLRSSITDPLTRSTGFVFTSFPKTNTTYPLITLKATNISTRKLGMRSDISWCSFNVEVRIWSLSETQADKLTQTVIDTLKDAQYSTTGTTNFELFDFKLNSVNSVVELDNEPTIHSRVCSYTYKVVLE